MSPDHEQDAPADAPADGLREEIARLIAVDRLQSVPVFDTVERFFALSAVRSLEERARVAEAERDEERWECEHHEKLAYYEDANGYFMPWAERAVKAEAQVEALTRRVAELEGALDTLVNAAEACAQDVNTSQMDRAICDAAALLPTAPKADDA